jgi:PAS domain-containing protein
MTIEAPAATAAKTNGREAWLESVLEGIGTVLVTLDTEGRISHINAKAEELLGVESEELVGQRFLESFGIKSSWQQCSLDAWMDTVLEQGQPLDIPCGISMHTVYGTFTGSMNAGVIRDREGDISGAVILVGLNMPHEVVRTTPEPKQAGAVRIQPDALFVRKDGAYVRIDISKIHAVEAMENYVSIWMEKERFVVHATMKQMQEKLTAHGFVRVHRSFIIPIDAVKTIEDNRILVGDKHFPIGKSYRSELLGRLDFI